MGEFRPFFQEIEDGYDTLEWCAAQPWRTGQVGMFGRSYVGATQWLAAVSGHKALACVAPGITASDYYEGWIYQGGAFQWGFVLSWTLFQLTLANLPAIDRNRFLPPETRDQLVRAVDGMDEAFRFLPLQKFPLLKDGLAPYFYEWLSHPHLDEYWRAVRVEEYYSRIAAPAFNIGGWFDIFLWGTLRNFGGVRQ